MHYFKFHHEVMSDSKVQTLDAETFRAWVNILCMASANTPRGDLPPMKQVAYVLHVGEDEARRLVAELMEAGLIDSIRGQLRPHNWDGRQGRHDLSTERSRKHRQKVKERQVAASETAPERAADPPEKDMQRVANGCGVSAERVRNAPRLEERRLEEKKESPSDDVDSLRRREEVVVDGGTFPILSAGHRETVEYARGKIGERFAAVVADRGSSLEADLKGRWDCYRAAIDELVRVKATGRAIDKPATYCRTTALGYVVHGIPRAVEEPMRADPEVVHPRVFPPAPRVPAFLAKREKVDADMRAYKPKAPRDAAP